MAALSQLATPMAQTASDTTLVLSRGIEQTRAKAYPQAVATLKNLPNRIPVLSDYASYYLALAQYETEAYGDVVKTLPNVFKHVPVSPLAGEAVLLMASAYNELGKPKEAIALIRQHYQLIPRQRAEAALARSFEAARDLVSAAISWQRVFYYHPNSDMAPDAVNALGRLHTTLGGQYPPAMSQAVFARAKSLMDANRFPDARKELESAILTLGGADRDLAKVRLGAVDLLARQFTKAATYLKSLQIQPGEADAERMFHLLTAARRVDHDANMMYWLEQLEKHYPESPWRLEGLVSAGYIFLIRNDHARFEPIYAACADTFRSDPQASFCHWKLTWASYLRRPAAGDRLFKEHMTQFPQSEKIPASVYFLARSAEESKHYAAAKSYYTFLDHNFPNHFYATLAKQKLQLKNLSAALQDANVRDFLTSVLPRRAHASFEANATTKTRFERARLLTNANLPDLAESELRFAARQDGQPQVVAIELSRMLDKKGAPDKALAALKQYVPNYLSIPWEDAPRSFWQAAFPMPYREAVERNSRLKSLDPYLVAGLIRQESAFNPNAISVAKAYGLTQVLPTTGRALSRQIGIRNFAPKMLFEPEINLKLGTLFLTQLLQSWSGKMEEVLASYNAGPSRVKKWITWGTFREPAEFIETIPFAETRDYVQIVLRNADVYRRLYASRPAAAATSAVPSVDGSSRRRTAQLASHRR
ncbi:MAG: transglycosylase SLT domain-containing protein [Candidatus Solibacter usitatus]|nr:transglycosylase SLT domain-containing protein [Candidatus Solibacter usitatus]